MTPLEFVSLSEKELIDLFRDHEYITFTDILKVVRKEVPRTIATKEIAVFPRVHKNLIVVEGRGLFAIFVYLNNWIEIRVKRGYRNCISIKKLKTQLIVVDGRATIFGFTMVSENNT